jgi:hypothetical protein
MESDKKAMWTVLLEEGWMEHPQDGGKKARGSHCFQSPYF